MSLLHKSRKKDEHEGAADKLLDVDASMQGSLIFRDPVNLRINGKFEGKLDTKGSLTVGETAVIKADITGDSISIAGRITGNITAKKELKLVAPAQVVGNIHTPRLSVAEGAVLHGNCHMLSETKNANLNLDRSAMSLEELAVYLEIDTNSVVDWANQGKIPAKKEGDSWRFDKSQIDQWVADGKIK